MKQKDYNESVTKEAVFGTLPVRKSERVYGLLDAFLVLSGYSIATWCYSQGAFMVEYASFWQLVIAIIGGSIFCITLFLLPELFSNKYGIDKWQWMKSIFGVRGTKVLAVLVILVNFPWFGVCADIFGSTVLSLFSLLGMDLPLTLKPLFAFLCVAIGTVIALSGPTAVKWTDRIIVPLMLLVGLGVAIVAFSSISYKDLVAYRPVTGNVTNNGITTLAYACALEAGIAASFSWCIDTAVTPRLCVKARDGFWATIGAYAIVNPLFIVLGGVLAIAMYTKFGVMSDDISVMLSSLTSPIVSLSTLILVVFANIATQATGSYMAVIVLKSSFPKVKSDVLMLILAGYATLIVMWGKIIDYMGMFLTYSTFIYGPFMGILFVDTFFVRKKKVSLRGIYELDGHDCYKYTGGFNIVSIACALVGLIGSIMVFDGVNYLAKSAIFNYTTASLFGYVFTGVLYFAVSRIPSVSRYLLRDRNDITV